MDKMNYYYGTDDFENEQCSKTVERLTVKRKMVKSNDSINLKIKENLNRNDCSE
jgi:hypothetical protein